jgi:hypothetical protein
LVCSFAANDVKGAIPHAERLRGLEDRAATSFDATTLSHFDAAEWAPSTASKWASYLPGRKYKYHGSNRKYAEDTYYDNDPQIYQFSTHDIPLAWSGEPLLRNPITGIAGCCARAASGKTADAPPSSVMNSRRLIQSPRRRWRAAPAAR